MVISNVHVGESLVISADQCTDLTMPRFTQRRCMRWCGIVAFYALTVFIMEYIIVLAHIQYLVADEAKATELGILKLDGGGAGSLNGDQSYSDTRLLLNRLILQAQNYTKPNVSHNINQVFLPNVSKPLYQNVLLPNANKTSKTADNQVAPDSKEEEKAPPKSLPLALKTVLPQANVKAAVRPLRPGPVGARAKVDPVQEKQRKELEAQWEKTYYRLKPTKVNPYQYDFRVIPKDFCDERTYMLVLVHSFHPYGDRRRAIRATWGSIAKGQEWPRRQVNDSVRLAFVLGRHKDPGLDDLAVEEGEEHNDIIQGTFMDAYTNMTLKSLLGLKFFAQHCHHAQVLLKSDDDMVINMPYLLNVIHNTSMSRSIMGPLNKGSRVYRSGKWKIPKEVFPFKYYPPYESGSAYIIAGNLVKDLYEAAEYVPSIFIDDVYITGILGKILNVTHISQRGFAYWTDRAPTSCAINEDQLIAGTKMKPQTLMTLWEELKRNVKNCPTPPPRKLPGVKRVGQLPKPAPPKPAS